MEDSQNSAPGSIQVSKLGGARKAMEPSQNAAKRYVFSEMSGDEAVKLTLHLLS
jgi:hypothetical protein